MTDMNMLSARNQAANKTVNQDTLASGLAKTLALYCCVTLLLAFLAITLYEHQRAKQLQALTAQSFVALAALELAKPLALDNASALNNTLNTLTQKTGLWHTGIKTICLYDTKGAPITVGKASTLNRDCPPHALATRTEPNIQAGSATQKAWYSAPIQMNMHHLGSLWVQWPNASLISWFAERLELIAVLAILMFISAFWILRHIQSHVSSPINKLTQFLHVVRHKKDFSRQLESNPSEATFTLNQAITALLTTIQNSQNHLKQIAFNDPLTCLPNRRHFWEHLTILLHSHKRTQRPMALMVIDLDEFKAVNDELGHEMGDALLTQVGQAMRTCVRQEDFLARLGGDEFTLILRDCGDPSTPKRIAQKIIQALDRTFSVGESQVRVGASIGIALAPSDSKDPHELTRFADKAMYVAKRQKHKRYAFWQSALNQLCDNLAQDEALILKALDQQALSIQLTPQHSFTKERAFVGVQANPIFTDAHNALAFHAKTQTLQQTLSIEEVIMQSDNPKLLLRYHEWFFTELSHCIKRWKNTPMLSKVLLPVTLHLAPHKLQLTCFVHAFKEAIRQNKITTADVIIQMHEDTLNRLHHLPIANLADPINQHFFSQLQVALTIDDLPDAYTILNKAPNALVKRLQFSALEHSAEQLADNMLLPNSSASAQPAKNIFNFAQSFGCDICVTHIDQADTWHAFRKLGATIGQGSYLSRSELPHALEQAILRGTHKTPELTD